MSRILFLFFILFSVGIFAQTDSLIVKNDRSSSIVKKKFDSKKLEEYKTDKDFNYEEENVNKEPTFLERVFNWLGRQLFRFLEWIFGVKYAKGLFASILSALPYIILGIVLFLLLKFFLKVNLKSSSLTSKNNPVVSITEEEELIKIKDISKLIQQAIQQKNYRLAVRYYYLNVLKQLENNELIIWEQQKTNEDYIKEISQKNIQHSFVNLTRLYDFVWYGNFVINETEFARVEQDFIEANNLIHKK
ncbi:hypothetical protein Lupro_03625 [Lutibacter profundi]|uniref:Protein-glutamine gamma-glutamyltransferase-like C-terminal domain-containing protein n=1 Tax=Lutibacter profundi TaxID=1622118 RepID=A0A0X8G5E4_9FLAO|nr:DUF4129 domain-containing protein [Lutibacter profundi]AMC10394.1 hypothetical protein Lupro_03625 [Lutibacter profundi]